MVLRIPKYGPSRNPTFSNAFLNFESLENEKHSPLRKQLLQLPAPSALSSAFLVKNEFRKPGFGFGPDLTIMGSLNLNMMLKIEL